MGHVALVMEKPRRGWEQARKRTNPQTKIALKKHQVSSFDSALVELDLKDVGRKESEGSQGA